MPIHHDPTPNPGHDFVRPQSPEVSEIGMGVSPERSLRVSSGTLNLLTVKTAEGEFAILERKAEITRDGSVVLKAQPVGGGIAIHDLDATARVCGGFNWENERVKQEQDFRVFVAPDSWPNIRAMLADSFLGRVTPAPVERGPEREVAEEIAEAIGVPQEVVEKVPMTMSYAGLVFQDPGAGGVSAKVGTNIPTARVFAVYDTHISDPELTEQLMAQSRRTNEDLIGTARANKAAYDLALSEGRDPKKEGLEPKAGTVIAIPLAELMTILDSNPPLKKIPYGTDGMVLADNVYALHPKHQEERTAAS